MNIIGIGRGGPFTVLLGLFALALVGAYWVVIYTLGALLFLVCLAGKGIRALYRRHKAKRGMHGGDEPEIFERRMPPVSPVEYRNH